MSNILFIILQQYFESIKTFMKRKLLLATGLILTTFVAINAYGNVGGNIIDNDDITIDGIEQNINISRNIKIDLRLEYKKPVVIGGPRGRAPIQLPSIYMNGRTIYLNGYAFDEIQLVMLDENGEDSIVFSSIICEGTETIEIPNDIIGEYEIRFCRDGYYFYGEIEL